MVFSRPKPCFLDGKEVVTPSGGPMRWRDRELKLLYEWDHTHGHIEAYNLRGKHVAVLHGVTGVPIKDGLKRRKISV